MYHLLHKADLILKTRKYILQPLDGENTLN